MQDKKNGIRIMKPCPVQKIFRDITLSQKEIDLIQNIVKGLSVQKGRVILSEGQPAQYLYYVSSGCLRTFFVDASGKEHTLQFAEKDWWVTDYTAFLVNGDASLNIESLEDAVIFRFSREDLNELRKRIPEMNVFFSTNLERSLIGFQKRAVATMVQSAKERYLMFINAHPNINKSVKSYHLASYLGITPESLSRIRKNLILDQS